VMISKVIIGCSSTHQRAVLLVDGRYIPVLLQHFAAKMLLYSNFFDLCILRSTSMCSN